MHYSATAWKKGARRKMQITDVRVRKVAKEGKLKAVVSITMDEEFVVHDIKVIDGPDRLFLAMPSRRLPDGRYRDIVHPVGPNMREKLEDAVLSEYQELMQHHAAEG